MRRLKQLAVGALLAAGVLAWTVILYAAASYPSSVKTFATRTNGQTISASWFNDLQDEVHAVEDGLLNGFAHALIPSADAGQNLGSSAKHWATGYVNAIVGLTTPLTVAQGGTGAATFTIHGVLLGQTAGAIAATSAGTTGQVLQSGGASADPSFVGGMTLACPQFSGTTSSSSAANLGTCALTNLTAKDVLRIEYQFKTNTQTSGTISFVSSTDSNGTLVSIGSFTSGQVAMGRASVVMDSQGTTTAYVSTMDVVFGSTSTASAVTAFAATTAYTAPWTLALRGAAGVGGSFEWRVSVYRLAGQ